MLRKRKKQLIALSSTAILMTSVESYASHIQSPSPTSSRAGELIVKLKDHVAQSPAGGAGLVLKKSKAKSAQALFKNNPKVQARNAKAKKHADRLGRIYKVELSQTQNAQDVINQLQKDPDIEYVEANYQYTKQAVPNDPFYQSSLSWQQNYADQWPLHKINIEGAWDIARSSNDKVTVAVIDTGIDYTHPDLQGNMWINQAEIPHNGIDDDGNGYVDDYYGYNFSGANSDPIDDGGHGTHVAGTIGAVTDNSMGIAGVALNVELMAVKVLSAHGSGWASDIASAIVYASDNGGRVINLSLGSINPSSVMSEAIQYAHAQGSAVIAAAGNFGGPVRLAHPANMAETLAVSATTVNNEASFYSNRGDMIDVAAPGGGTATYQFDDQSSWNDILSLKSSITDFAELNVGGDYLRLMGTSMAAPHVSGLAAMLLSVNPSLNNEDIRQIIRRSATDIGEPGKDDDFGYGLIDAERAMQSNAPGVSAYIQDNGGPVSLAGAEIRGSANGKFFKRYEVSVTNRQTGATHIVASSQTPISNDGVLAHWQPDAQMSESGYYDIRLTVFDKFGGQIEFSRPEFVSVGQWPLNLSVFSNGSHVQIASVSDLQAADLDNDGQTEIIATPLAMPRSVFVYDSNAQLREGWPVILEGAPLLEQSDQGVLVGDINGNGESEIIVYAGDKDQTYIHVLTPDGKTLAGWPQIVDVNVMDFGVSLELHLVDIDSNGTQEILVSASAQGQFDNGGFEPFASNAEPLSFDGFAPPSSAQYKLYAFQHNGMPIPSWHKQFEGTSFIPTFAAAVAKQADGQTQVAIVRDSMELGLSLELYADNGTLVSSTPVSLPELFTLESIHKIRMADLNNDGQLDWLVPISAQRNSMSPAGAGDGLVLAFTHDGNPIPGWPVFTGRTPKSISLADVDQDGCMDVVTNTGTDISIHNCRGKLLTGWPKNVDTLSNFGGEVVIGDISGDGQVDIITVQRLAESIPNPGKLFVRAWNAAGEELPGYPRHFSGNDPWIYEVIDGVRSPLLTDIDNDGNTDMLLGFGYKVLKFSTSGQYGASTTPWPTSGQNSARTSTALALEDASIILAPQTGADLVARRITSHLPQLFFDPTLLSALVCNQGEQATSVDTEARIEIRDTQPVSSAPLKQTTHIIPVLPANSCIALTSELDRGMLTHDRYQVTMHVDPVNLVEESNETNNTRTEEIALTHSLDVSGDISATFTQSTYGTDVFTPVTYTLAVTNHSAIPLHPGVIIQMGPSTQRVTTEAQECGSNAMAGSVMAGCIFNNGIAPGETLTRNFTVEYTRAGDYPIDGMVIMFDDEVDINPFNDTFFSHINVTDSRPAADIALAIESDPHVMVNAPTAYIVNVSNQGEEGVAATINIQHSLNMVLDTAQLPSNCTQYHNTITCHTQPVPASSESIPLSFTAQQTGYINLTARVHADTFNDGDLSNNIATHTRHVAQPGDLNGDSRVDANDRRVILQALGSCSNDNTYNPQADLNHDQCVTAQDLAQWSAQYLPTNP